MEEFCDANGRLEKISGVGFASFKSLRKGLAVGCEDCVAKTVTRTPLGDICNTVGSCKRKQSKTCSRKDNAGDCNSGLFSYEDQNGVTISDAMCKRGYCPDHQSPLGDISNTVGLCKRKQSKTLPQKDVVGHCNPRLFSYENPNGVIISDAMLKPGGCPDRLKQKLDDRVGSVCRTFFSDDAPLQQILREIQNANKSAVERSKRKHGLQTPLDQSCLAEKILNPPKKHYRKNQSKSFSELNRSLFSDKGNQSLSVDDTRYCEIENSFIHGFHDLDHAFLSDDDDDYSAHYEDLEGRFDKNFRKVPLEYASLGPPSVKCDKCSALLWKEERINKSVTRGSPKFNICCGNGKIRLPKSPATPSYLWQLYNDSKKGAAFHRCSRIYNSMFAFTSTGGIVDNSINNGGGPYIYRLNGQNHHLFGSLIPSDGQKPKFCQLYIYDTENEVSNRLRWVDVNDSNIICEETVSGLISMLDETNELVQRFRMARDRFENNEVVELDIFLKVCRSESGRENHTGPSNEVAGIVVGDEEETEENRDFIVVDKVSGLQRVTSIHPKLMAFQYPLLFPTGEDGFHDKIYYQTTQESNGKKRQKLSMKDFYSYKFQVRRNEGMTARLGGRLFQQYVVDAFSMVEQARLWWLRTHQTTLRNDLYSHICDSIRNGDSDASNLGKSFILPAGYVGSKRYMQQNFQDALAVCRYIGHPDIFLTMTTNPLWDEIVEMMKLIPFGTPVNNPDIIARVFKLKLDQLLDDIRKKDIFGKCIGVMYVVEFQKRGLPHVHMLIWLDSESKKNLKANVDKFVSAEIPDPVTDAVGYAAVKAFMIHGPCGTENPKSPCMKNYKCSRHFPKKYQAKTTFDESGFPLYMRRKNSTTIKVRNAELDSQWVVPYNRDLLVKYQCHINIEICCHARSVKYLFKYCLKGPDRATVEIRGRRNMVKTSKSSKNDPVDEIQAYFDGRYICGAESAYRMFGFDIHHRTVSVERLSFHLPGKKNCTFKAKESLEKVINREKYRKSKLEAFFHLNSIDSNANQYTYDEIPRYYVWNDADHVWTQRKKGFQIGRLTYTHHSSGEIWYLRMLLAKVRGPVSFKCLRKVNGVECSTFQEACNQYGFLNNDNEWHEVLTESAKCGFPPQIRQLFVHIIFNCQVTDLNQLWTSNFKSMSDDILYVQRLLKNDPLLQLSEDHIKWLVLAEIDKLLRALGKSLKDYPTLPQPPSIYLNMDSNNFILDEISYDRVSTAAENSELLSKCNEEQVYIYHQVLQSVEKKEGGVFFVYGSGGCGKTYLWRTLISKLRSEGKIVLPVTSSGIAATLLPGGRTAHSRFKIPILLDDYSICNISHDSDIAELLKQTSLIIWDEAPMQHRYAFECLDRTLKDLMKDLDTKRSQMPFGGITVLFGGDFRQILPVIPFASRADVVSATITRSRLWPLCKVLTLTQNMRLHQAESVEEKQKLKKFSEWVIAVGDGTVKSATSDSKIVGEYEIEIPIEYCNLSDSNSLDKMIEFVYPEFEKSYKSPKYLSERAILTPTNKTVSYLNELIVEKIPGDAVSYFSVDSAEDFAGTDADLSMCFPTEYLNSLCIAGLPSHELKLKPGVIVMLMRNLNQTLGLCNGTRMIVTKCLKHCLECEVICGNGIGTRHFIPRIDCSPSDSKLPFKLVRKQMPLQICYAMTINKSQGQSLEMVGLYLPQSVFTHGQLYVALSRVTCPSGLKLFIDDEFRKCTWRTENVVYKEVFYSLPVI